MLVSHKWISELLGFCPDPEEMATRLTMSGLELESLESVGRNLDKIVVGEILAKSKHPKADKLSVVEVTDGAETYQVVCGAPNCPGPGSRIILAKPGARVGEFTIESRELRGVASSGMICSEQELDIGLDHEGIMILDGVTDAKAGTPISEALDLEDYIIDLSVTPNRPDALCHRGVARETALLFNRPFEAKPAGDVLEDGTQIDELATIDLVDADGCPRYGASVVRGVSVKQSPFAIRYKLHNLGVRPISNIVDMTNLIVLEYGQPLHAFDLDELADSKIVIRKAGDGEKMVTLDEIERTLTTDDLLICDGAKPVAIAGVMGGQETGVTEKTKNILIECAYFEPSGVRRTSKRLKLSSESSYRFERGVDPNMAPDVLLASSALVIELAGGKKAPGVIDCYPTPIKKKVLPLRPSRFESVMGYKSSAEDMRRILTGLDAVVSGDDEKLEVQVPTNRPDIEREVDLIEEVARVQGLDKIPVVLPRIRSRAPERVGFELERRAKELLASLGLEQCINYSFAPESMLVEFKREKGIVKMANPLSTERDAMRTTLVPGLLENLVRARSRFMPGIRQFEVGRTFVDIGEELPEETTRAAALLAGPADNWVGEQERQLDFFDAKGLVTTFVRQYAGLEPTFEPSSEILGTHPKRACQVSIESKTIGFVGELHPDLLVKHKQSVGACAFELNLEILHDAKIRSAAEPLSEFPPMERDLAMLVAESLDSQPIIDALKQECGSLASEISLFDIYRGKGIKSGNKSLAFKVVYRSNERTLTDDEVDAVHNKATANVLKQFDAVQR